MGFSFKMWDGIWQELMILKQLPYIQVPYLSTFSGAFTPILHFNLLYLPDSLSCKLSKVNFFNAGPFLLHHYIGKTVHPKAPMIVKNYLITFYDSTVHSLQSSVHWRLLISIFLNIMSAHPVYFTSVLPLLIAKRICPELNSPISLV